MPVATSTILAIRCHECGKMDFHDFSRFSFAKGESVHVKCTCGATKLIVSTKKYSSYWLQIPCVVCETKHLKEYSGKALWSGDVVCLTCQDTELELGHIGPISKIREMTAGHEQELEALIDEFGCDSFFHNSKIMYEVLNCLHVITERGALYCQCGNYRIEVDIFPDRLELQCKSCGSINIIYAETEEDLKVIQQVETIELARNGFNCLDSLANSGKIKKTRRKRNKT
ncbi:MAG TPA: hypothetical protein PK728_03860 [Bacillota bacterium]|nr:hypothetical protein [Bacillota bacterium]